MEKQIEDILKKHIRTQNSLIDEKGHNHWIDTINALSAILTSEVEKERERLLKEVGRCIPKKQDFTKTLGVEFTSGYNSARKEIKRKLLEQRKALSDIGGKDEK